MSCLKIYGRWEIPACIPHNNYRSIPFWQQIWVKSGPFGLNYGGNKIFPRYGSNYILLVNVRRMSIRCSEKNKWPNFEIIWSKNSIFWPFWHLFPDFGKTGFFPKNRAPSLFGIYGPLTSCKKPKKSNDPIPRKTPDRRTDRRTRVIP